MSSAIKNAATYKVSSYRTSLIIIKILLFTPFVATITTTSSILTNDITKLTTIIVTINDYSRDIISLIYSFNTYNKVDIIINIIVDIVASYAIIKNASCTRGLAIS